MPIDNHDDALRALNTVRDGKDWIVVYDAHRRLLDYITRLETLADQMEAKRG